MACFNVLRVIYFKVGLIRFLLHLDLNQAFLCLVHGPEKNAVTFLAGPAGCEEKKRGREVYERTAE